MNHRRLEVQIYQIADDAVLKQESHRWDGMGMGLGRLAARLDERDAQPVCVSLLAAHDHQSDRLVDQKPRGFHGNLARVDSSGERGFPVRRRSPRSGGTGSTASSVRGSSPGTHPFSFAPSPRAHGFWSAARPTISSVNAHPLTALIESDWVSMSFTMNWKIMVPNQPVRFECKANPCSRRFRS